jgi:hypothetical protein
MRITRVYKNTGVVASSLLKIGPLVDNWGHKIWGYVLKYCPDEEVRFETLAGIETVVHHRGETRSHLTHLESPRG